MSAAVPPVVKYPIYIAVLDSRHSRRKKKEIARKGEGLASYVLVTEMKGFCN